MRIEEIRVRKAGIQSSIRNAFISFSEMTLSVVRIRFDHGAVSYTHLRAHVT